MSTTRKEADAKISKGQLRQDVELLIKQIKSKSEFNIETVHKETEPTWFEV